MRWRYVSGENAHWLRSDGFVVRRTGKHTSHASLPTGDKAPEYDKAPEVAMARIDKHYPVYAADQRAHCAALVDTK